MDINNLRAFVLVAETGSFSEAAEKLHLTQPAVSKRVALLEEQLGAELFDRIGRVVSLTEAGNALLPHAKSVQRELARAERSVRDLSGEVGGQLRLATSHHIGLHRLPPVLSHFSRDYPAVHIDIDFMDSEQAYELINQGKAELAVVTLAPEEESSLLTTPVWQDPLEFMIARDHELLRGPHPPDLKALSRHPAILPGLNTYTGQIIKRLFDQHQLSLQVTLATNYLETIRMMASVGLGWTILPRSMRDSSLTAIEIENVAPERTLGLVYHRGRSLSRAAQAFVEAVLAAGDQANDPD
ncbi:LysR family transcriptional regulator [Pseudohalioglobus lutimaris]|uniref:LysR family transcriptional regulator n=1 Tax=Pseudohalioglobus lutimaris TaxID=1737061 RepID=A0A2N5X4J7_9GAMM|nr:LysR family transcriptional regulator [Pseudohalioglobus lutimaris]PLW69417.1 LysR family transcriptional regulator [Pseudohalioglobus lutimaris]